MTGHGRDVDDVAGLLPLIGGSAAAIPCSTPMMLTSTVRAQSAIFRRSSGECGITPALLRITSTRP